MNFIGIWHPTVVMSHWLVGGRWVGFEFQDDHILCLSMAQWGVMCYPLPPRPSFLLMILSPPLLSAQSPLASPLSDLLSALYPTLFCTPAPISRSGSVCAQVKPLSMESGNWQIACVRLGRSSLYVCQAAHFSSQRQFCNVNHFH